MEEVVRAALGLKGTAGRRLIDNLRGKQYQCDVLVRLSKWLLVLTLCLSIGAHWAILQSVAWCGMAVSYSQGASLKDGLTKTFDGKHPCKLCKMIAEGKKSEKKQQAQIDIKKLDFISLAGSEGAFIPPVRQYIPSTISVLSGRVEIPPTPPPRLT